MTFEYSTQVPADHPALPGHFPGNPVVPGVVLLDEVLGAAEAWLGECTLRSIPTLKFLRVLRPSQPFTVRLNRAASGEIEFSCDCRGETIAMGRMQLSLAGEEG